jgi:hypothetical protein
MLRKCLTNNWLMISLALAFLVVGIWISVSSKNFQWLSRFGALVICTGVVTLARPGILREDIKFPIIMSETGLSNLDPEHWKKLGQSCPDYVQEDLKSRTAVGWLGPLMCLVGTATNGFADLLNKVMGYP